MARDFTKVKFTPEELRECYIDRQMTQREIARYFHTDVRKVRVAMQNCNMLVKSRSDRAKIVQQRERQKRNRNTPRGPVCKCPPKEELLEYRNQGMSFREIGELLGLSRVTISNVLRDRVVPTQLFTNPNYLSDNSQWDSATLTLYREYYRGAIRRNYSFELTEQEFYNLIKGNCHYCGKPPVKRATRRLVCNGIDRADNKQGYTVTNTRSCCSTCNRMKGTLSEQEFIAWIRRAANHLNKKQAVQKNSTSTQATLFDEVAV